MKRAWLVILVISVSLLAACATEVIVPTSTLVETESANTETPTAITTSTHTPTPTLHPTVTPSATLTPFPVEFPLGETAYLLPPTIRYLTKDTVTIFFELDQAVKGKVLLLDEAGALFQEQDWETNQTRHMITFEGLLPGFTYRIQPVITEGSNWQAPVFLGENWPLQCTTQSDDFPLRIGVISDASFGDEVTQHFVNEMADDGLDFVLHLGDVVDETEWGVDPYMSYAENFYLPFAPLLQQLPIYTVPGNHDYDGDIRYNEEPFYFHVFPPAPQMANRQYYSLAYNDIRFLFLDSQTMWGMPGREEQDAWLAEQLADDSYRAAIPILHIAPFSSSSVHPDDSKPIRNLWVPQFEEVAVPLVFSGHFHHYEHLTVNGITYIVAGGGSAVTYALGDTLPESAIVNRTSHYILLEIQKDTIRLIAIDESGAIVDDFSIDY